MTASPPPRAPARTVPNPQSLRATLRFCLVVTAGLVLVLVLVAGCGSAALPPAAPSTIAPTTPATPPPPAPTTTAPPTTTSAAPEGSRDTAGGSGRTPAPQAGAPHPSTPHGSAPRRDGGAARGATPIWPAGDPAALQRSVDGGRQPWLLDPVEVAISYAGSELGYRNPDVFPLSAGSVDLQDGGSPAKATITLAQPARRGEGGIWLVTGVRRR